MILENIEIVDKKYFAVYNDQNGHEIKSLIDNFDFSEQLDDLGFSTQASAVCSSNIEGNSLDLNSFMNYQLSKEKFKPPKEVEEIENLIKAYHHAQKSPLNKSNFLLCHKLLLETLLIKSNSGNYRTVEVGVFQPGGLVYLAIEP